MQINELIKLTDWFQAKVVAKGIPANFQALFNKMNANIRRNLNQPMQPFSTERDALFEAIGKQRPFVGSQHDSSWFLYHEVKCSD